MDGPLERLIKSHPIPTWRPFAWFIMIVLAGGLVVGLLSRLDDVTMAV